ncbi:hypothetical protein KL909_005435 [Ogataea angusta]|nr:hypothetical protein KL909_005435 [Ogataea angusta]
MAGLVAALQRRLSSSPVHLGERSREQQRRECVDEEGNMVSTSGFSGGLVAGFHGGSGGGGCHISATSGRGPIKPRHPERSSSRQYVAHKKATT